MKNNNKFTEYEIGWVETLVSCLFSLDFMFHVVFTNTRCHLRKTVIDFIRLFRMQKQEYLNSWLYLETDCRQRVYIWCPGPRHEKEI